MNLQEIIQQAGFRAGYLLPVPEYKEWTRRRESGAFAPQTGWIEGDPGAAWPWANSLLLLIWPYQPYVQGAVLSGYYPASHRSYMAMRALQETLSQEGIRTDRAAVPVKTILTDWGLGSRLDNDLIYLPGFGTRFIVQALMASLPSEMLQFVPRKEAPDVCIHCRRCRNACPGGAISPSGYDWQKCLRAYEEGPGMPEWVMEKMTCLLGCEVCQDVCPLNHFVGARTMTEEEAEAFALEKLLSGDLQPALALIGKNMKKGGKLTAQAAVLAANRKREDLLPVLEAQAAQAEGPLKETLEWAIFHLKSAE